MARLCLQQTNEGDVEDALLMTGLGKHTDVNTWDDVVAVDFYDQAKLPEETVRRFAKALGLEMEHVEQIENWPVRGWAYARYPVRY